MKIYTKGGDAGETGLYGGARVPKDDLRIRAYGSLDEVNAVLGMALAEVSSNQGLDASSLLRIQGELFQLGAELATPRGKKTTSKLIEQAEVLLLEKEIDQMESVLPPLKNFILPGGTKAAAITHFLRTVSRRAERELITLNRAEPVRPVVIQYLNRLSDYFFVVARFFNHKLNTPDQPWLG
ncbi:MAG: cob(I)yrinic acid a,c-diamide adenosyltransferase [Bdellovibrio sp.]|nr:cob(I)yrinic acid a,c-diamide adenosyltransferase [Bdellovibrio sp.]